MPYKPPVRKANGVDVYVEVDPARSYVCTVDTARGRGQDYSAFSIFDVSEFPYQQVAKYRDPNISPLMFPNIIENVARLNNHNKGATKKEIFSELERIGYKVESKILNAFNYGVPQNRRRIFFIASLLKGKILFPDEEEKGGTVKAVSYTHLTLPTKRIV